MRSYGDNFVLTRPECCCYVCSASRCKQLGPYYFIHRISQFFFLSLWRSLKQNFFKHIQQKNANTVLSIVSFLARIFGILALVLIGWLAKSICIKAVFCFTLLCICFVIPLNLVWLCTDKKLIKDEGVWEWIYNWTGFACYLDERQLVHLCYNTDWLYKYL